MTAMGIPANLAARLAASARDDRLPGLPPVERWHPAFCGDSLMRIARDGTWFYEGEVIKREGLVRLFSTILRKDDDGFMLVTPDEKLSIAVEDAPFIAVLLDVAGAGADQSLTFTTNVGDAVVADAAHALRFVLRDAVPVPYLDVRRGLEARISRPVYYQLAELAEMRDGAAGVWSGGVFFRFEAA